MSAPALKPCPFCGGTAEAIEGQATEQVWPHGAFHRVFCTSLQARQIFHRTEAEAVSAWNTRPDHAAAVEAAVQAERDACRAEAADEKRNWSPDGVAATACEAIDRRIRARGPTDALAAELAKAREEWRELAVKAAECIERLYTINMTPAPDGAAMKTAAALRALAQEAPSDDQ